MKYQAYYKNRFWCPSEDFCLRKRIVLDSIDIRPEEVSRLVTRKCLFTLSFLLIVLILIGCEKVYKEIPTRKAPREISAEREIGRVIDKWLSAFEKKDYTIQWELLSSKSPLRDKFTPYFSFDERLRMSEVEKNKAAFLGVSSEAFGPFKSHEVFRIVVDGEKARVYLVLHWGGHTGMGEAFIRPMRKKLTLELVKERKRWLVLDEKDGFENIGVRVRLGKITELVPAVDGSIVEIFPNQDGSALLFETEINKLGILNSRTHKIALLPLFLGKDGSLLQAEWSPSGEILGIRYDLPEVPEVFSPEVSFFRKNGNSISTAEAIGFFMFASEESIVSIFGEEGAMKIVEHNYASGIRRTVWDDERSRVEGVIPLSIIGVSDGKIVFSGRHYEGYEWEYSPGIIGTIDIETREFQKLTDRWYIFPGVAHALKGQRLAFLGGRPKIAQDIDEETWEEISLVVIDLVSRDEKAIKFMGSVSDMEVVDHFSWSPWGDEVAFEYGTMGFFLASVEEREFQGIYPRTLDGEENSRAPTQSGSAEIWTARWSPEGDKILFVNSPGKVFVASRNQIWEPVEVKALLERLGSNQCDWLSEQGIVFVGWGKAGEKNKSRTYAEPSKIYTLDVSLK